MSNTPPRRALRERPDLDQLKRQAKELLRAYRAREPEAVEEVTAAYRDANPDAFTLIDAQLVLARSHGFTSWAKLKAHVEGVTLHRASAAVKAGDIDAVRTLLDARPELVHVDMAENNEHRLLHYAVLARNADMARLVMRYGADPHKGIYPHRDATSALTIATDRGYEEIVAVIGEEETRRRARGGNAAPVSEVALAAPSVLRAHGAELTPVSAVALGDADWLRRRHATSSLATAVKHGTGEPTTGLLTIAVKHQRPEILALLLEFGLDPNERTQLEDVDGEVYSAGMPLHHCATVGDLAMAKQLLDAGADPNVHVYAAGSSMHRAYSSGNAAMIELLARYGGVPDGITVGAQGHVDVARRMLDDEAAGRLPKAAVARVIGGDSVADDLLWGAAGAGATEIVEMALARIDWPRDDGRWYTMLREAMYLSPDRPKPQRDAIIDCFRTVLARCDPSRQSEGGRTLLHDLSGARFRMLPEDQLMIATMLLDAGARLDTRDPILESTPLGWACRWGHAELVELLLSRGADAVEVDAAPWATPRAWAERRGHSRILQLLSGRSEGNNHDSPRS